MGYLIAAYGVTIATLLIYGVGLARERARLARDASVRSDPRARSGDVNAG